MSEQGWREFLAAEGVDDWGAVADRAAAHEVQLAIAAQPDAVDVGFC
jgi:hypothetical protein